MKTTQISFACEWHVHWQGPGYPEKWMGSDNPKVSVRMHVYAESSGNGLDARLESLGLGEDWCMYGQYDAATWVWAGRWWAAPIPKDTASDNRWGYFSFTLAPDGKTFTGQWDNEGLHKGTFYGWDGYKVCEAYQCAQQVKGGKWPRK